MGRSGYEGRDAPQFIARRLVRLEPPYLVALLIAVVLMYVSAATPGFLGPPVEFSAPFILLHVGYLNALFGYPWINPVFWSLAIELQFYVLMALLFPALTGRLREWVLLAFVASSFALSSDLFVFHYAPFFALGIATWWYRTKRLSPARFILWLAGAGTASTITIGAVPALVAVTSALLIALTSFRRVGLLSYLGAISYSLYLLHVPIGGRVINLASRFGDSMPLQIATLTAAVVVTVASAHLLHRYVERPSVNLSQRMKAGFDDLRHGRKARAL
jgi:peptidoglycan/LPS O-acetylase OafA/YrhL